MACSSDLFGTKAQNTTMETAEQLKSYQARIGKNSKCNLLVIWKILCISFNTSQPPMPQRLFRVFSLPVWWLGIIPLASWAATVAYLAEFLDKGNTLQTVTIWTQAARPSRKHTQDHKKRETNKSRQSEGAGVYIVEGWSLNEVQVGRYQVTAGNCEVGAGVRTVGPRTMGGSGKQ